MSASRVKLLAVGLFAVCGLGVGGSGWLATAEAQSEPRPKAKAAPATQDKIKQLEEEIARLKEEIGRAERPLRVIPPAAVTPPAPPAPPSPPVAVRVLQATPPVPPVPPRVTVPFTHETTVAHAAPSEYDYVLASGMTTAKFTAFLREREAKGWEYKGEATLQHEGKAAAHWVFKKATRTVQVLVGDASKPAILGEKMKIAEEHFLKDKVKVAEDAARAAKEIAVVELGRAAAAADAAKLATLKRVDDLKANELKTLEIELGKLKELRATATAKPVAANSVTVVLRSESAEAIGDQAKSLAKLAATKFKGSTLNVNVDARTNTLTISGTPEAVKWIADVIKSIDGK